jgi:3-oxoacyl-[acyl-carrier protein] reductase
VVKVVICYTSESSKTKADDLVVEIDKLDNGSEAIAVTGDMGNVDAPQEIVKKTVEKFKHIDIIVNNAGVTKQQDLGSISADDFAFVYNINVRGPLLLVQAAMPHLNHPARIINLSSVGARANFKEFSLYMSSKAALEGMTRAWAADLGKFGTTVNAVAPGPVQSDMLDHIPASIKEAQKQATAVENRFGLPKEQADVVCWLASAESSWVSGQVINTSGGWTMY